MTEEPFITCETRDEDILVMTLRGKLDDSSVEEFHEELERQFEAGFRKFIINCAHLGYISSRGIGALVRMQVKLRQKGGEVKLATVQSIVADVFRLVHIQKILDIYGDVEFARESFYDE